jgi:tetratricopeptide (TPR) repeat protein
VVYIPALKNYSIMTPDTDSYQTRPDGCVASFMRREDTSQYLAPPSYSSDWLDWSNHASALFISGRTGLALIAARHALNLERTPSTLINLAVMLESQSQFYPAFSLAEEAYRINPNHPYAAILYSDALLRMGRLMEAWPIYSRSHANWGWVSKVIPEWDGRPPLLNKRILVLSGGGYGDNFLHLRWIPRLKALGAHVNYMCPASMHSLLEGMYGFDRLIAGSVAGLEGTLIPSEYDYYTCVLSLGEYFCRGMEEISSEPYIRLRSTPTEHIGLCAIAGEEKIPRRNRSLTPEQAIRICENRSVVDLNRDGSWRDTAALISTLHLVVTVDTGVAHLAGAMGIKTFVILPGNSAAYYGIHGTHSPFYQSQRLFRNNAEGMDHAVSAVRAALESL